MTESLQPYFKNARTWADDNFGRLIQSRNRYQAAFMLVMSWNIISLAVIATLAHYQTLVPLLVHHYENGVTTIEPIASNNAPINRTQVESDIVRYIQYRESYDASSYRAQFELINLLSDSAVGKEYVREQDKNNPNAPIQVLGSNLKREVHIYSINFLDSMLSNENDIHKDHQPLAEVVFSLIDTDKITGKITKSHYNAMISWSYIKPSDSPEVRWQNWDGFEVTRYSKEARHVEHAV
ncbi:MAG: type IV secretion system protein [Legionellaceae bacterium]|nr:type IV secretion system protein [Legionellaceae bacterium]